MSELIRLGVIIPDRSDRPRFLENCLSQLKRQTLQPDLVELVNFPPSDDKIDITKRYRIGYDALRGKDLDLIGFLENDECYAPNYLEYMVKAWKEANKPDLFGTNYTIYWHLKIQHYFYMFHEQRSSMMNTFIKPNLHFDWCPDDVAFTDMHLWDNCKSLSRVLINPQPPISIGIKHGIGLCGGFFHTNQMDVYHKAERGVKDEGLKVLRSVCDDESFEFFSTYFKE